MNKRTIIVFTPTLNEYQAVDVKLTNNTFKNFAARAVFTGPGKINASFAAAAEILPGLSQGTPPAIIIGAGTSGSLNLSLKSGDIIFSDSAVIADWILMDGEERRHARYDDLAYEAHSPETAEKLAFICRHPLILNLGEHLESRSFHRGRMLTSDIFMAGLEGKLDYARRFDCLACDMESGVLAYLASQKFGGLPWFNLRVVADTLGDSFADYVDMEIDMVSILGQKLVEVLTTLDDIWLT